MQLYSIASGSSGNCIYVGGEEARILIDAGISMKRIREGRFLFMLRRKRLRQYGKKVI